MRRSLRLEIHRDDHTHDALGQLFLGALDREAALELLRAYVGSQARVRGAELEGSLLVVEADVREFAEETENLMRLAREMSGKGRGTGALAQLEEALRLSPWSPGVLKALGRLWYRHREPGQAQYYLTRAREVAPQDVDVLRILAELAMQADRRLQARQYLECILALIPGDRRAQSRLNGLVPQEAAEIRAEISRGTPGTGDAPVRARGDDGDLSDS